MIRQLRQLVRGVNSVGADRPIPGTGGRLLAGGAVRVLLAGAAITWSLSTLAKLADDLRTELQELADERNRLRAELDVLHSTYGDEVSREPDGGWVAGDRPDDDDPPAPLIDRDALAADVARRAGEPVAGACTAMNPIVDTSCVQLAGHRGAHRDAHHRVWRRLAAAATGCEELSPGDRFTCRMPAGHEGPHAAGEYSWTSDPLPRTWVTNPDGDPDEGELDPEAEAVAGPLSAP